MKKIMSALIAVLFLSTLLVSNGYSGCGMCGVQTAQAKDSVAVNRTCPVMGGKIRADTPYSVEYKGQKIGFCCPACVKAFKANPEKYMKKIEAEKGKVM